MNKGIATYKLKLKRRDYSPKPGRGSLFCCPEDSRADKVGRGITFTRSGRLAAWESGGGLSKRGEALLWALHSGEKPAPIFVRRRGHLACQEHALIPLSEGHYAVHVDRIDDDVYSVVVYYVKKIKKEEIELLKLCFFDSETGWEGTPAPRKLKAVVDAAVKKSRDYHCRDAYWVQLE